MIVRFMEDRVALGLIVVQTQVFPFQLPVTVQVVWFVALCHWLSGSRRIRGTLPPSSRSQGLST